MFRHRPEIDSFPSIGSAPPPPPSKHHPSLSPPDILRAQSFRRRLRNLCFYVLCECVEPPRARAGGRGVGGGGELGSARPAPGTGGRCSCQSLIPTARTRSCFSNLGIVLLCARTHTHTHTHTHTEGEHLFRPAGSTPYRCFRPVGSAVMTKDGQARQQVSTSASSVVFGSSQQPCLPRQNPTS